MENTDIENKNNKRMMDFSNLKKIITKTQIKIDWKNSIGCDVPFECYGIKGIIKIISYNDEIITLLYNSNLYKLDISMFLHGYIGAVIGVRTKQYKFDINEIISDSKSGKLKILAQERIYTDCNKKYGVKGYKYQCLICGNIDMATESNLLSHTGCSVCSGKKILKGYNDMWTTNPKLASMLLDENDGYRLSYSSNISSIWKCPECGNIIKNISPNQVERQGLSCHKCSDGISYPNKFIFNILNQLNINFECEKTFKWAKQFRYDFYLPEINIIIEVNGRQHYDTKKFFDRDNIEIDKIKYNISINNNIKDYIVIDASESNSNYIYNSILNSNLSKYFNFDNINTQDADTYACLNILKSCCNDFNNGIDVKSIVNKYKISNVSVYKYLRIGSQNGWCNYSSDGTFKKVRCINTGEIFDSIKDACNKYNLKRLDCYCTHQYQCKILDNNGKRLEWEYIEQ